MRNSHMPPSCYTYGHASPHPRENHVYWEGFNSIPLFRNIPVKQQDRIEDPQNLRPTITEDTQTSAAMTRTFQVATSILRQISRGASVFKIPTATNYMGRRGIRGRLNLCWIWWLLSGDGDDEDYRMARWVRMKMIIRRSSEYSQCDYYEEGAGYSCLYRRGVMTILRKMMT